MDIGRAFSFVFEDSEWVKKVLIGGLISLIPLIGGFVVYGYVLEITRRVYLASGDELPEWDDFGGYLARGFIYTVGLVLWLLPVFIVVSCVTGALIAATSGTGDDAVATLSGLAIFGLVSLVMVVVLLWAVLVLPVVTGRYAVERRFGAMFEFGEIMAEIRRAGVTPLLLLLVTYLVAGFVGQLGVILCVIGVIFTSFYTYLVIGHGAGQVYRRARGLGPGSPTGEAPAF